MASIINAATSGGLISTGDTSGQLQLQTAGTTALTVTSGQLVGIGTSSPSVKLDVVGQINNTGGVLFGGSDSSGSTGKIQYLTGSGLTLYSKTGSSYDFTLLGAAGNNIMRIPTGTINLNFPQAGVNFTANGIGLGGTSPSSGTGIAFPATQSASSDANTLDDYEEGTFTPTVSGAGSVTYSGQYGIYTKIGTMVFVTGKINVASSTLNANIITINGLPFTAINSQDTGQRSSTMIYGDWQNMGSYATTGRLRIDGASIIGVRDSGGSSVYWYYNDLGATGWKFNFCLTYITS